VIVVLDASPIIFLGKLGRLNLVKKLLGGNLHLVQSVRNEVAVPFAGSGADWLDTFLDACTVHQIRRRSVNRGSLSRADAESITLAKKLPADIILADDRLLRRVAEMEGIRPLGTLGVILRSVESGLLSSKEARVALDALVSEYYFRISVEVYQSALARLS